MEIKKHIPLNKKIIGGLCIALGIIALLTPFTPGSWLLFIGLELLGIRLLFIDKIKKFLKKDTIKKVP